MHDVPVYGAGELAERPVGIQSARYRFRFLYGGHLPGHVAGPGGADAADQSRHHHVAVDRAVFCTLPGTYRPHHSYQCASHVTGTNGTTLFCRRYSQGAGDHAGDRHGSRLFLWAGSGLRQHADTNYPTNRPVYGDRHLCRAGSAVPAQLAVRPL
ncbi:hypothetical protein D3C79_776910 [compost metagenome]